MLDPALLQHFTVGAALIVATVAPNGAPHAGRAWGVTILSDDAGGTFARILVNERDTVTLDHLTVGAPVAVTAADVPTLRAVQIKGHCLAVEPATAEDRRYAARSTDAFFTKITEVDGASRQLLDRWNPVDVVACVLSVDGVYDQTPGPGAGAPLQGSGT